MKLRIATQTDWPTIIRWRNDHVARIKERQESVRTYIDARSLSESIWIVAEEPKGIVAAVSFLDFEESLLRYVFDIQHDKTMSGIRGALLAINFVQMDADRFDYSVGGFVDVENVEFFHTLERFGYEIVEVKYERPRKSQRKSCGKSIQEMLFIKATREYLRRIQPNHR